MASAADASQSSTSRPRRAAATSDRGGAAGSTGSREGTRSGRTATQTAGANKRRDDIVTASALLFDANGYEHTSMEDISNAVGLAKPTLYHYFKSKVDILVEMHETFINVLIERQEARLRAGARPDDQLLGVTQDILALMESHRGHVRVFFEHHRELPPDARRESRQKRNYYESLVTQAIVDGVRQGIFSVEDPHLAALALFGICNWAYQWWTPGYENRTTDETAGILYRTFANGLVAAHPRSKS